MRSEKGKKKRTGISFTIVIVMLICGVILYRTSIVNSELDLARQEYSKLENIYEDELDTELELESERNYKETDQYIEDIARNNLGMVYPDEILIVPSEDDK